jgi:hypothetical protein
MVSQTSIILIGQFSENIIPLSEKIFSMQYFSGMDAIFFLPSRGAAR